ncbi:MULTISPECIES: hypothetical protein [Coprobacillaceae]|uniref:hypothetical protein n=1 Tax=Coprobacillaceae TaxID=2810280 RepID=UPI000E50CC86|nr:MULTISPECIES: hypothetical protein [Coprobacillaceae]RHM60482.1 hypothetical protein DWZ53_07075 [Coprobacillus sp. AF33-1AC]RHS95817.1 hypothetical protein DW911_02090 [Erysipelatoclostridium sp. AM42-17]
MKTNQAIGYRFLRFFKYLRNLAIMSFIIFIIINAINTGNTILYWITYACMMIFIVSALQSVVLYLLSKYYLSKK